MKRFLTVAAAITFVFAGCAGGGTREDSIREVDEKARQLEFNAGDSRTLSSLAKIEESLANYIQTEKKIPATLDELVPKYLAQIPAVEIAIRGHHDNERVKIYPASVLRDGVIDGTRLKDTGYWGYVFNERQVVVFVDCTHKSARGRAWYLERGAY